MKKVLSIAAISGISLFMACKKSHTCTCTYPVNGHDTSIIITEVPEPGFGSLSKGSMKNYCKSMNETYAMIYTTGRCQLD